MNTIIMVLIRNDYQEIVRGGSGILEMKTVWSLRSEEMKATKVLRALTGAVWAERLVWFLQRLPAQSLQSLEAEESSPPPASWWEKTSIETEASPPEAILWSSQPPSIEGAAELECDPAQCAIEAVAIAPDANSVRRSITKTLFIARRFINYILA